MPVAVITSNFVAGLLTYFKLPRLPSCLHQWQIVVITYLKLTAAGTVQDSHLIPYYPNFELI